MFVEIDRPGSVGTRRGPLLGPYNGDLLFTPLTKIGPAECGQSESCRHVWLSGVAGSAAIDELGKVGQAVAHKAANFGKGEVVPPGGAPDRKRACLYPKSCSSLLIVNLVWWPGGVIAESYCYFNFDCFEICADGH